MNKWMKNASGVITVMVSLLLIPLLSFGTLIMEAGRYVSAKQMLADAQITASMSILANYNVYLYERFGILAIDPAADKDQTQADFVNNLKYNSDNVDNIPSSSKLYNLDSDISFKTIYNLSDYGILKRQILEYAKYSVPYEIISKNLDPQALFQKISAKLTDNAIFNFLEKIALSSEESVNVMDLAFTALGRYEYRALDLLNFLSEDSKREYTKDSYTDDLYSAYIKKDEDGGKGKLGKYKEDERYISGREDYIEAITAKVNFMSSNPDPKTSLDNAKSIYAPATNVNTKNLYKAVIKKFLEDDANKPTDEDPFGARIYNEGLKKTMVQLNISNTYEYTYDISAGTASVYPVSGSSSKNYTITTAVKQISGDSDMTVNFYDELEDFAEYYNITSSADYYLGEYNADLKDNGKAAKKTELVNELTEKKNAYDAEITRLNGEIDAAKPGYIAKLNTAKDKFNELIKSIEDDSKKVKKLVTNDDGKMVEGTENTQYNDGAIGRLKYAQETYEQNSEDVEGTDAENRGSNSQKVSDNVDKVISFLEGRKTTAQNAVTLINTLISNVSSTQSSSIKSYWNTNGADYVTGNVQVGATCGALAGYVSSDFSAIEEFVTTPVVDAEGSDGFDMESLPDKLGISDIWNSIKRIKDIMNFVPAAYDPAYVVKLNDSDVSILPNMEDSDDSTNPAYEKADEEYKDKMLDEVKKTLGDVFSGAVLFEGEGDTDTETFRNATSSLFGSGGEDGSTDSSKISDLSKDADNNKSTGVLKLVTKLKDIINTIKEAFEALKNLFGQIKELLTSFIEQTMHSLLINTYIIQKFPSRMNPVNGALTYPTGSESGSYFSSCCVEYCMFGKANEKTNQSSVFWLIFGIKAVMNCIQILMDTEAMSIVSSCNMFAPLMFIAMLYMETNIDMNYLLRLGQEVPIWKDHLNLSAEGLMDIAGDLIQLEPDASGSTQVRICTSGGGKRYHKLDKDSCFTLVSSPNREVKTTQTSLSSAIKQGYTACQVCKPVEMTEAEEDPDEGIIPLDYNEYLYVLMLFMSTKTKLRNLANLIQLETRYYQSEQKITPTFLIDKASTYVRSQTIASYDSLLPMFSLGSSGGFAEIGGVEYVGY